MRKLNSVDPIGREKYQRLIAAAQKEETIKVAVAHPCDDVSLRSAIDAQKLGLIDPLLVAPPERVREAATEAVLDISAFEIVASAHRHDSAAKTVELVKAGRAEALMKGSLHTDELMGAIVAREGGIRTERRISHCFIMDVPGQEQAVIITDAAVNIASAQMPETS
jgi:phosphate acetyltransferase